MEHFHAPLPSGNIMRFQLVRETNAGVARALPCTVWNILLTTPNLRSESPATGSEHPPVKDLEVRGTFLTMEAANNEAESVLEELKLHAGKTAVVKKMNTVPRHPPMIFYVDDKNQPHEIYVAPGRWNEVNDLLDQEKWEGLSKFPPWSDQPPRPPRQVNQLSYTDGRTGEKKAIHLPQGTLERASELFMKGDWAALEQEFEEWTGNQDPPEDKEAMLEHARGVERMRIAREKAVADDQGD